ncbi:MAG TPA: hypothetical protein VK085_12050 [Pseudogracilibacillus sp.]|nr:hypothetical protein [Pseudogracilibacillus sp.]
MRSTAILSVFFALCTFVLIILNLFAFMRLISFFITLPLLFLSIYLTLYTFSYRNVYRGSRKIRNY